METPKQGFHSNELVPFEKYIKSDGINRSFLFEIIDHSPGHAKFKQDNDEITDALRLGDAFHAAILEPKRFEDDYVILPADCRPGGGPGMKGRKEIFETDAERRNQTIINQGDYDNIREMQAVVQSSQECLDLLQDGESEFSAYYQDPDYDTLVKVRLDFLNKKRGLIIDLKSCRDARHFPFRAAAYSHGYDIQAWMNLYVTTKLSGVAHQDFRFICIESKGYHGLKIYRASQEMLDIGRDRYCEAMEKYIECVETEEWPGYPQEIEELGAPDWMKNRIED